MLARIRTFPFDRFAAVCAFLIGPGSLAYAALFISIVQGAGGNTGDYWLFLLMAGALFTVPAMIAVYERLRLREPGLALTGFLFALGGALGGVLHGGYELAAKITPPPTYVPGPEAVDKGVLRYGVAGLALLVIGFAIARTQALPAGLGYLGMFGGVLLCVIYIGRLFDFITPGSYPSLIPPILFGFVVNPLWYGWLALILWRGRAVAPAAATA